MWLRCCCASRASVQEEERERRMDFVPDVSAVNTESIEVRPLGFWRGGSLLGVLCVLGWL